MKMTVAVLLAIVVVGQEENDTMGAAPAPVPMVAGKAAGLPVAAVAICCSLLQVYILHLA